MLLSYGGHIPDAIRDNKMINERFTFRFYQFCNAMNILCCIKGSCSNCKDWWCSLFKFPFLFFYCIFPIIPFSNCNTCKCINDCSCEYNIRKNETNRKTRKLFIIMHIVCLEFPMSYVLCLRPILSTFTFLFRSFSYFVFVALPIRVHILRYTILAVTTATYFVKYFHEIVNMNAEVLKYVFICEVKRKKQDVKYVQEEMFDFVYGNILFVKKKLYFLILKMMVVFMYLFITIETFITNQPSLTGETFNNMLEFLFIIIGPYAISLFMKASNEDFLTDDNKAEIEKNYRALLYHDKETQYQPDIHNQTSCGSSTKKQNASSSETPSGSGYTYSGHTHDIELQDFENDLPDKNTSGDEHEQKQNTPPTETHDKEVSGDISRETDHLLPKGKKKNGFCKKVVYILEIILVIS